MAKKAIYHLKSFLSFNPLAFLLKRNEVYVCGTVGVRWKGTAVSQIPTPTTQAIHKRRSHSAQPGTLGLFCPLPKELRSHEMKP